jgi:ribonuclease VapC
VIFLDTSAVVAMLAREADGPSLADKLEAADERITAGHVILESVMRLSSLFHISPSAADSRVTALLRESSVEVVPITEETAHIAVAAFERYGKGRKHRANLNFGDCLSYACAKAHGAKLLFKGGDFAHTDIAKA